LSFQIFSPLPSTFHLRIALLFMSRVSEDD
jgi:hypothetical protein